MRYEVVVQHKRIVYAETPKAAKTTALRAETSSDATVTSVKKLPPVETERHPELIDGAPSREARK